MSSEAASLAVEAAVRESYGKLLTFLARHAGGDLAGAEDALGDALLGALRQWPEQGVPDKPQAWLLAAARRKFIDHRRRVRVRTDAVAELLRQAVESASELAERGDAFPDERLSLLFVCTHPAIDAAARAPLMLQTVLGLDAARIASAFLTSPASMSQRLVRTKQKIRDSGIPFEVPPAPLLRERLGSVLDAIYAAFGSTWTDSTGNLAEEALRLARILDQLLPAEAEVEGLLALMLHCQARVPARLDSTGEFIPLAMQDPARWDQHRISEAETILHRASSRDRPGRFQLEAAIQSVHAARARTGVIAWPVIAAFYDALIVHTPSLGARIGRAVAISQVTGPATGLAELEALPGERVADHQPYWAARGHLLAELNRTDLAENAYRKAVGLCTDDTLRRHLMRKLEAL